MGLTKEQKIQEDEYDFPYHYLDLKCDMYKLFYYEQYRHTIQIIKDMLRPFKGQTILDAGCGDGRFCQELSNENVEIVGVDFSQRALSFARLLNPTVSFVHSSLNNLQLNRKFDQIVCINVIEHILPDQIPQILEGFYKLLNKEGKLVIAVPSQKLPLSKKHFQHFSKQSLEDLLKENYEIISFQGCFRSKSFKNSIFRILKEIKLLFFPIMKTTLFPLRRLRFLVKKYFNLVDNYFLKHIKFCSVDNGELIIVVAQKK